MPLRRAHTSRLYVLSALLSLSLAPTPLTAQTTTTGAISGHIVDPLGHPISTALITVTDLAHIRSFTLQSNPAGDFLALSLPPSEYTLDIRSSGFGPLHLVSILVELGATARVQAALLPSSVQTSITVTSDISSDLEVDLDAPPAATSTVISSPEISRLPIDGRRWQTFALLTPQANPGSSSDAEAGGLLSFSGLAPTQNSSRIDGADNDQSFNAAPHGTGTDSGPETEDESESAAQSTSGNSGRSFSSGSGGGRRPGAAYTFSQAAVREFHVAGQNYSALYGHAAGGVITTVSKSGTGTLHGSAFFLVRESAWAATNPFSIATRYTSGAVTSALVKPDDHRYQFGGTIGGPVLPKRLPGRLFYFYAFDAQRRSFPAVSSPENPAFYNLSVSQRALLGNRGVTSAKIDAALTYIDSLTGIVPRRADQTVNFLKFGLHLTPRNQLSLQANRARFSSPAGIRSAPVVNCGTRSFGSQNIDIDSLLARWIYARGAAFSNELRIHGNRDLHSEQPQTPLPQEPAASPGGLLPRSPSAPRASSSAPPPPSAGAPPSTSTASSSARPPPSSAAVISSRPASIGATSTTAPTPSPTPRAPSTTTAASPVAAPAASSTGSPTPPSTSTPFPTAAAHHSFPHP